MGFGLALAKVGHDWRCTATLSIHADLHGCGLLSLRGASPILPYLGCGAMGRAGYLLPDRGTDSGRPVTVAKARARQPRFRAQVRI